MTDRKQNDSRSGIAIIIVLGVLGVMLVLSVAFVVSMRTESVAAGYYVEIAKSRALVHTALARAMADLDQDIAQSGYPALWSQAHMPYGMANAVDLYIGEARELLPQGIYETALKLPSPGINSGGGAGVRDNNASWSSGGLAGSGIQSIGGGAGTVQNNGGKTLTASINVGGNYRIYDPAVPLWSRVEDGRIAYLIVNLSGLLDAQYVGDENTPRSNGVDLAEIDVSELSDMPDMATLVAVRSQPFETLVEMAQYGGFSNTPPRNWCNYSRYPTDIGGFPAVELSDAGNIQLAFAEMAKQYYPNPADQTLAAQSLYNNWVDYQDLDSQPGSALGGSTDGPWVEAVPMISEVYVTNTIRLTAGGDLAPFPQSRILAYIEYAYPFVHNPSAGPFRIDYTIEYVPGAATPAGFLPAGVVSGSKFPINPTPADVYVLTSPLQPAVLQQRPNPTNFQYTVRIQAWVRDSGGAEVDKIPVQELDVDIAGLQPADPVRGIAVGADVIDPVYNWHSIHWQKNATVFPYTPTPGEQNSDTDIFYAANPIVADRPPALAVRNAAMKTVGELGCVYWPGAHWAPLPYYQLYYAPLFNGEMRMQISPWLWRSVRLLDHGDGIWDRALDYLTVATPLDTANGPCFAGLVNPNSEVQEVLAAVFHNMPLDNYPGQKSVTDVLDWSSGTRNALTLAAAIQNVTALKPLTRTSDLGRSDIATAISNLLLASEPNASEVRKESFIRNAASLFHTRQNLFLILLAGQTAEDPSTYGPPLGVPRTDQRAMAVVWRDPVADANGRHRSFVRWFTWLEK